MSLLSLRIGLLTIQLILLLLAFFIFSQVCVCVDNDGILPTELAQAADMYKEDLPHPVMLCTEYNMWVMKWKQQHTDSTDITNKLVDTFNSCSELQFPNLHVLLRVALTLPITSCESKWSFSQLKLIKTSYRSTMTNNRLGGLALMKINRDYCNELSSEDIKDKKHSEVICSYIQGE